MLGTHKDIGRVKLFRCPFGEHRRLKLHVNECDGVGLWRCWACDKGGDIFTLAAELKQLDIKAQFPDVLEHVAEVLNISLDGKMSKESLLPQAVKSRRNVYSSKRFDAPSRISCVS